MFTGIVMGMGRVLRLDRQGQDARLGVATSLSLDDVRTGDSVAVNGACLTATDKQAGGFTADVSAETLSRTNLRFLRAGSIVNLEKSLKLSDVLGGHLVLGHVDGLGTVLETSVRSRSVSIGIRIEPNLCRYVVEKGSIAVDGVSLTVNRCAEDRFYVTMIPHTGAETTLGIRKPGDLVNIETDILAKYVEKLLAAPGKDPAARPALDAAFLAEHGFIK